MRAVTLPIARSCSTKILFVETHATKHWMFALNASVEDSDRDAGTCAGAPVGANRSDSPASRVTPARGKGNYQLGWHDWGDGPDLAVRRKLGQRFFRKPFEEQGRLCPVRALLAGSCTLSCSAAVRVAKNDEPPQNNLRASSCRTVIARPLALQTDRITS
jgi:hypothetical protein